MRDWGLRLSFCGLTGLLALAAGPAFAAMTWLDCTGQAVTTTAGKPDQQTSPAHDVYAIDDAAKAFYKYAEARKALDVEPVTAFDDAAIKWAEKPDLGALDTAWEGVLDRKSLALKLDYRKLPETTSWTEQCRATDPLPIDSVAASGGKRPG